ncbi:MAG: Fe-S cluster assembly protein SufD, partial [Prevotellaceae bacterium]|jgi:Fe-S cluster assembly protein SufD|nr:Fe-S cluster assembly protein SufD [Prevotellaceae bacterium]
MHKNFHYTPATIPDFHCHVPLTTLQPSLVVNGVYHGQTPAPPSAFTIAPYENGMGIALTVAAGAALEQPLQIINVRTGANTDKLVFTNTFLIAPQARAQLIICDHTLSPDTFMTECTTTIVVQSGAQLELLWMQSEHNRSQHRSEIRIRQAAGSMVTCNVMTLHGAFIENVIDIKLQGENAGCRANGLFLIDGTQRFVTDISIAHEAGHCRSNQLFKGIINNEAVGRFHGRVLVAKNAQKTEAFQANNNLLLTKQAKMYTQPQLEIYADDVKCSHGATIGQLDEQALFYLRSRGIALKEARLLQQIGFVQDVLDKIGVVPLRERIAGLVEKRLQGEFSRCVDCELHCC